MFIEKFNICLLFYCLFAGKFFCFLALFFSFSWNETTTKKKKKRKSCYRWIKMYESDIQIHTLCLFQLNYRFVSFHFIIYSTFVLVFLMNWSISVRRARIWCNHVFHSFFYFLFLFLFCSTLLMYVRLCSILSGRLPNETELSWAQLKLNSKFSR